MSMFIMLGCFIFQSSMSKSRSFRDASLKSRPVKYKRNKTTNLDKLTSSMSAHTLKCPTEEEHQAMISGADHSKIKSSSYSLLSSKKKILVMIRWKGNFCSLPTLILRQNITAKRQKNPENYFLNEQIFFPSQLKFLIFQVKRWKSLGITFLLYTIYLL